MVFQDDEIKEKSLEVEIQTRITSAAQVMMSSQLLLSDTAEIRFFCRAVTSILSPRLLHKMTNSRAVFIARIHAC